MAELIVPAVTAAISYAVPATASAAFSYTVGTTVVSVTYAQIAATVAVTAAFAGLSYALASAQQQRPASARVTLKQGDHPLQFIDGRRRNAGVWHFHEATKPGGYFGGGQILCVGPVDAIEKIEESDREFAMTPWTSETFGPQHLYIGNQLHCDIEAARGFPEGLASSLLRTTFPSIWTTDHLCKGFAALYIKSIKPKAKFLSTTFPNAFPSLHAVIRGSKHYDHREAGHDPDDDWTDPATWEWTENPALIIAGYLRNPLGPIRAAFDDIDWDSFDAAADLYDSSVNAYGEATEPWARGGNIWDTSEEARAVLGRLLLACDSELQEDNLGRWKLVPRQWVAPRVTFTDADIAACVVEAGEDPLVAVNRLIVTYADPQRNWAPSDSFIVDDTDSQDAVGVKSQTLHLECCPSRSQAYRMAWRFLTRQSGRETARVRMNLRGLLAFGETNVTFDAPAHGLEGVYRIEGIEPGDADVSLVVRRTLESDFGDITIPADPADGLDEHETEAVETPAGLTVTHRETGGVAYLQAGVNAPSGDTVTDVEFEWKLSTDSDDAYVPFIVAIGAWDWESQSVAGGATYNVRARFLTASGFGGNYTSAASYAVPSLAPAAPSGTAASAGGTGEADLTTTAPNDARHYAIQFWRADAGDGFGDAVAVGDPILSSPNQVVTWTETGVTAGDYHYWATSQSAAGEDSAEDGPASVTVT